MYNSNSNSNSNSFHSRYNTHNAYNNNMCIGNIGNVNEIVTVSSNPSINAYMTW